MRPCLTCATVRGDGRSDPIVHALDAAGYRLTGPRRAVAELMAELDGHFTAAELEAAARERRAESAARPCSGRWSC